MARLAVLLLLAVVFAVVVVAVAVAVVAVVVVAVAVVAVEAQQHSRWAPHIVDKSLPRLIHPVRSQYI